MELSCFQTRTGAFSPSAATTSHQDDGLSVGSLDDYSPKYHAKRRGGKGGKKALTVGDLTPWEDADSERKRIEDELRSSSLEDGDDDKKEEEDVPKVGG